MDSPGQAVQGQPLLNDEPGGSGAKSLRGWGGPRSTDMSQTKRLACPLFLPLERPRRGDGFRPERKHARTSMVTHSYFFFGCLVGSSVSLFPVWPSAGLVAS